VSPSPSLAWFLRMPQHHKSSTQVRELSILLHTLTRRSNLTARSQSARSCKRGYSSSAPQQIYCMTKSRRRAKTNVPRHGNGSGPSNSNSRTWRSSFRRGKRRSSMWKTDSFDWTNIAKNYSLWKVHIHTIFISTISTSTYIHLPLFTSPFYDINGFCRK
jgi:hypothetical protein